MRAVVVGVGEAGRKHLAALARMPAVTVVGVVELAPLPAGVATGAVFTDHRRALEVLRPDLVVVACPPGTSLRVARDAAAAGARVLVEKPVVIDPGDLEPADGDDAIAVAFQPHFAPGIADLLAAPPSITRAEVFLSWRRDRGYYRGWRARWATGGGILHQQAIHGLALALRLLGHPSPVSCIGRVTHRRGLGEAEDHVRAVVALCGGGELIIDCAVDSPRRPRHELDLIRLDGTRLRITGGNLEAGLGDSAAAPTHTDLRAALYQALIDTGGSARPHPCLYPLRELRPVLEVIDCVYRSAGRDSRPAES